MAASIDRRKYLDQDEVKRLRTVTEAWAITDLQHGRRQGIITWMVVDLALSTGLRVSEIALLQIEDIDLRRGSLSARRLKKRLSARLKAETLAIGQELTQHLKGYLEWTQRACGPLFMGQRGAMTSRGLQQIWTKAVQRAGLPADLSIHSARHTVAVHLLKKTGNLRQVQKQLGHSSPATTANMYADISFEDMQQGMAGLYG